MSGAYLALIIDDLPLAAARLGGACSPCAVTEQHQVIAADPAAESAGVMPGISSDTALALMDISLYPRSVATENALMNSMADWAYRHSSWVHLQGNHLIMEVAGSLKLFGTLEKLWERMQNRILQRVGRSRIGLASSPEAAIQLARLEWQSLDLQQTQDWLPHIPIHSLPLDARLILQLQGLGFKKIADLQALTSAQMARRFPKDLMNYLNRLMGRVQDPRPLWQPKAQFESQLHLQQACKTSQALIFPMHHLIDQFEDYLKARQLICSQITLEFLQENRQILQIKMQLGDGLNHAKDILEPIKLKLSQIKLDAPVSDIFIRAADFHAWQAATPDLLNPQSQDTQVTLLNALKARLGEQAVQGLTCSTGWIPENANQTTSWPASSQSARGLASHNPLQSIRPTWLLSEPKPLSAAQYNALHLVRGPERIESEWWNDKGARRDYYVAWHQGTLMWVYQDLRTHQWCLQGLFG